jgi:hypothetical protein
MVQQIINVGATPNDGEGDPIRDSFIKTNENFTELYTQQSGAATGVYYVSKSGSDANSGTSLGQAFLTIKRAVTEANIITGGDPAARVTIFVKTGTYNEINPIEFGPRVTLVGDNLRSVNVIPITANQDIFHLTNGDYIWGVTFRGHLSPASAIAYPSAGAGFITTSPYIQNCSSITTTGCGLRVDGNKATGLRSMVTDAYTQINQGGLGVHILNQGYAQLVSIFTICCSTSILCESGGTCSVTNSNTSFGTYGLVADGGITSTNTGTTDGIDQTGYLIHLKGLNSKPTVNQTISFDSGATRINIWEVTPLVGDTCTVRIAIEVLTAIPDNTPVSFYTPSVISASGHTFEYVGTGTDLTTALPQTGATPIPANQVRQLNYGQVIYTSTDQRGDFKVGDQLTINGSTGTISGDTFDKSLFAVMTPYILALEG